MRTRCLQAHRIPPHKWTPEDDEFIRTYAPGHLINEIQEEYKRRFNTPAPTASAIQNRKTQLGVKSGIRGGCFEKNMTPWNKGKTWDEQGRSEESKAKCRKTCFKKGNRPHNSLDKPIAYADRETLEAAMDIARARHAIHSAKCRPRDCKACGETFTPRYPHQRTCDLCLSDSRNTA